MTKQSVWRWAMYGGFAGVALGSLMMMANWTSTHLGICAIQFCAIVTCGIGAGLVVAFGPVHSLAWVFGVSREEATWQDFAKRVTFFAFVAMLAISLLTAHWKPGIRLEMFMCGWVAALLILMSVGPKLSDSSIKRWCVACCDALAAVYGPFLVAALSTWIFDGSNTWLRIDACKHLLFVAPGGIIIELTSALIWHQHPGLSPSVMYAISGLLSALMVVGTMWLAAKAKRLRWILLPLICGLCAFLAFVLDALFRA